MALTETYMSIASDLERHMLDLINAERAALGLQALRLEQHLNASAEIHSDWMLDSDIFSHSGRVLPGDSDASSATDRMRAAGFDFSGSWRSGENLAVQSARGAEGYFDDVEDLHVSLMNSPGHRANILRPEYEVIGIGIELGEFTYSSGATLLSVMATQNFAATDGVLLLDGGTPPDPEPQPDRPQDLMGSRGGDMLTGGSADDTLNGWYGHDTIDGGAGADKMIGGPGGDLFHVDDLGDLVLESRKWGGTDTVISSVDFRMGRQHIENLFLTGEAVLGAGNGLRNEIRGNDQDNILDGGPNIDTLIGGAGNDTYLVRTPGDTVIEGPGRGGADTVKAFFSYALPAHVERLYLHTVLTKAGDPLTINGIGNGLDNLIIGNPYDNLIAGREGRDTLRGQAGADTFVFDRAPGRDNVDRIIDFNTNKANEGDLLKMKGAIFGGLAAGLLEADLFVAGTRAQDGNDRFIFDRASGQLWFDGDGAGGDAQRLVATFEQNAQVTASDIEIF